MINKCDLVIYDGYIVNVVDINDRITANEIFCKVADFENWISSSKLMEFATTYDNYYNLLQSFDNNPIYEKVYLFLLFNMKEQDDYWDYNGTKIHNYQYYRSAYKTHYGKDLVFSNIIKCKLNSAH